MAIRPYKGQLPVVHPSAFIDPTAQVIGDVVLGAESSVWMNTVIRGDVNYIRIGDRSNVQDLTIVHVQHVFQPSAWRATNRRSRSPFPPTNTRGRGCCRAGFRCQPKMLQEW